MAGDRSQAGPRIILNLQLDTGNWCWWQLLFITKFPCQVSGNRKTTGNPKQIAQFANNLLMYFAILNLAYNKSLHKVKIRFSKLCGISNFQRKWSRQMPKCVSDFSIMLGTCFTNLTALQSRTHNEFKDYFEYLLLSLNRIMSTYKIKIKENLLHSPIKEVERVGREVVTGRDAPHIDFGDGRWWWQGLLAVVEKKSRRGGGPPRAEKRREQPSMVHVIIIIYFFYLLNIGRSMPARHTMAK